jgi:hypothetical protein
MRFQCEFTVAFSKYLHWLAQINVKYYENASQCNEYSLKDSCDNETYLTCNISVYG